MNIYSFDSYRKAFTALFEAQRDLRPGWSSAALAEKIGVQPSHLTNVIKERNHFSSDQIFSLGAELGLTEEEMSYLDLLMEWERSTFSPRKAKVLAAIQKIRDKKLRAEHQIHAKEPALTLQDSQRYYLDSNIELLHFYLGTKNAPSATEDIAAIWGLSSDYVAEILQFLQRTDLIEWKKNKWNVKSTHQYLSPRSPLCKPQQMLKRLRALEVIQNSAAEQVYSFSGTLSMSEDTRLFIQGRFVEFLKDLERAVLDSPPHHLYHLQFDLFPWLNPKRR